MKLQDIERQCKNYPTSLLFCMIHDSVKFGKNVRLGFNVIIERDCVIGDDTLIGHFCVLRPNSKIGKRCKIGHHNIFEGDCQVGDDVNMQPHGVITRGAIVEDKVFIGSHFFGLNDHKMCHLRFSFTPDAPTIKHGARIGGRVTLKTGITIGRNSLIGTNSLVTHSVPDGEIWYGIPAKYHSLVPKEEYV